MAKLIIGLVGPLASGKGTVAAYLKDKHSATTHRFSTMLRDIADRLYLDQSRPNMQKLSQTLREAFGQDLMAKVIAHDVAKDPNDLVIVDGIRRYADIEHLQNNPTFHLVSITAAEPTRYERMIKRGENADDLTKTFDQFQKDGQEEAELQIQTVGADAEFSIDNNGSLDDLHQQIETIVTKLQS